MRPVVEQTKRLDNWERNHASGTAFLFPEDRSEVGGRALTRIDISNDLTPYQLPAGATGQVAIYTDNWHPVAAIRRILLRMKSWMNYVIP